MKTPRSTTAAVRNLFSETPRETSLEDKRALEALTERLRERLSRDPALVRKAALVLGTWLEESSRSKK